MPWERTFLTQYLCAPSIGAHESLWALPAVQLSLWRVLARPTAPLRARAWIAGISLGTRSAAGPALQAEVATGTNLQGQHGSSTVTETLNFFTQIMQTSSSRDPQLRCQKGSWIIFSLCALLSSPQELFPSARRQSSLLGTWRDTLLPPSPGVQGFPEKLQRRLQKSEEKPEIRWIKTHGSRGKKLHLFAAFSSPGKQRGFPEQSVHWQFPEGISSELLGLQGSWIKNNRVIQLNSLIPLESHPRPASVGVV